MTAPRRPRVVLPRANFPALSERLRTQYDVIDNPSDTPWPTEILHAHLAGADAVMISAGDPVDARYLDAAPRLRVVSAISVGYNHIDVGACTAHGILLTNTPDVLTDTTADHGFALLMAAARRVTESERWLRDGQWNKWRYDLFLGADLHHSTLGILGMGRIGQAIARRASGFDMQVRYHNRSRLSDAVERDCNAQYVDFDTLLAESDHLVLVLPYTAENHHIIDAAALARMKPTATLVNISRGGLIDEPALAAALAAGRLGAAGLDVYEEEPNVHPDLLAQTRIALTPHIGSGSVRTRLAMANLAADNLDAALAGGVPKHLVNADVLPHRRSASP